MDNSEYYVLYEEYTEYNQFEGSWDKNFQKLESLQKAIDLVDSLKKNRNYYTNIIGPLREVELEIK